MAPPIRVLDATVEPLTVAEAKAQVRSTQSAEDALVARYIKAMRQAAEDRLERTLLRTTWRATFDAFSPALRLPNPRLISVESLKFLDRDGAWQTLDPRDYLVDIASEPGFIVPAYGKRWPETRCQINAVVVDYVAGYGAAATDIPEPIRLWIALAVGDACSIRTASGERPTVPHDFAKHLLDPYLVDIY
jgi:uncharacterized phiE125 gp8 family phage protein